jgi:hypothetical protein
MFPSPMSLSQRQIVVGGSVLLSCVWLTGAFTRSAAMNVRDAIRPNTRRTPRVLFSSTQEYQSNLRNNEIPIEGLALSGETVEKWNDVHYLIKELQIQIPSLLTTPLSLEAAKRTYTETVRLLIDDVELASSRDELMGLNQALVLAGTATARAASFLQQRNDTNTPLPPVVTCRLGVNTNLTTLHVEWEVANPSTSGESLLELNPETRKIASHRLECVRWNGQEQDASTIGRFLSTSRQAMIGLQQVPFLQPFLSLSSPILNQVRDEFMIQQQLSQPVSSNNNNEGISPPVFVVTDPTAEKSPKWIPVDDYKLPTDQSFPFPGSTQWPAYVASHQMITTFCRETIPALKTNNKGLTALFTPQARLYATDGSLLLQGADRLAHFYQSLATWRQRSFGSSWSCDRALVLNTLSPKIQVEYTTQNPIPGDGALVRGVDVYTLVDPSKNEEPLIEEIRQTSLVVGEGKNSLDGVWLMRSLATAIETGRFRTPTDYSSFWMDLLQLSPPPLQKPNGEKSKLTAGHKRRSDRAALNVYRIMESLHDDICNLVIVEKSSSSPLNAVVLRPPVSEFLSENVKLSGYLEETLLRGRVAYNRNVGLSLRTLRASLKSGQVSSDKAPTVRVELTAEGNVRCALTLHLKVQASIAGLRVDTFPLKFGLMAEYVVCPETGLIQQHRLLESRINGQLTPADVVSRGILRFSSSGETSSDNSGPDDMNDAVLQTIIDTVSWVRSLGRDS